ncbi:MAG: hypothetical protein Q7K39_01980 [Candidatus Magasanikbacteria bacterium]|nr:hypothetical protein [Candidatus Magasanikbacteria bacterium]
MAKVEGQRGKRGGSNQGPTRSMLERGLRFTGVLVAGGIIFSGDDNLPAHTADTNISALTSRASGNPEKREPESEPLTIDLQEKGGLVPQEAKDKLMGVLRPQIERQITRMLAIEKARSGSAPIKTEVQIIIETGLIEVGAVAPEERSQIIEVVDPAIKDATEFFNHSSLVAPKITHDFPPHDGQVKLAKLPAYRQDTSLPLMYVKHPKNVYNFSFTVKVGESSFSDHAQMVYHNRAAGTINREMNFEYDDGHRLIGATFSRDPVLIMTDQARSREDLAAFATAEMLHAVLSTVSDSRMLSGLMSSDLTSGAQLGAFFAPYHKTEEAVVHAASRIWMESYIAKTGIKFSGTMLDSSTKMYPGLAKLLDKVPHTQAGANQLIDWYINSPEKIQRIIGTEISR